ncbi:hypothetical protein H634G_04541 [Metarhizium anisopliae BRIP 53293]|uniref:SNARE-complex protein Syntaxin-18 N-terminal domain-containing protein n=1 Tax=Metarhizium anisopliae BRIP 53293 TaxID=1291518 RepID=A0A0D9P1Z6_METAN|nr:hypothetical protein H634G_04541 [Metarhizium anisopliae BRIP 53293]
MAFSAASQLPSTDLTDDFNHALQKHNAAPTSGKAALDVDVLEGFVKEAYRINSHITSLHKELRDVRQAYLSTAQPRRTPGRTAHGPPQVLTDREREDVDVNAKQMIRELNASIRGLEDAEQLRRETESALIRKKYASGFSALSSWASGGSIASRSPEHAAAEAQAQQTDMHRDGILWYLRQRLELCCETATQSSAFTQGLTEEQLQMFEEGNQDMMQHYESTLDKVRTAEKSLVEISELQSLLVNNLEIQSEHIEQLVTNSLSTADNIGGGNKQLEKATKRPSTARYTFFAASGLCAFLVLWDLII